jgi:formate hydrogenlyase transcriptional activator
VWRLNFEELFESLPDAILLTDAQGKIVQLNGQAEAFFGYRRDELLGQLIELLVPERLRAGHTRHRETYQTSPHRRPMGAGLELAARRKDGSEFPVDIMLSPLDDQGGGATISVIRDATNRKKYEAELRLREEQFRLLVESIKDYAIFMLDADGRIISWGPGAERTNGFSAEEVLGKDYSMLFAPEEIERGLPRAEMHRAALLGRTEDEGWRVRKDGTRFWANIVTTAIRDPSGNICCYSKVARDITQSKQALEALLVEFSSVLISSMDIRQLLTAIASSLHRVAPHDYASLALLDSASGQLYVQVLSSEPDGEVTPPDTVIQRSGSPEGWTLTSRKVLTLNHIEDSRFRSGLIPYLTAAKMQSACWLPLVSRDRVLGTLNLASRRPDGFREEVCHLLSQLANQVALAIDNALAFQQIAQLKDRLAEEKMYLEDELRTEYNFDEIIGKSHGLRRVLKQVETVAATDATVLIVGETGTGKELLARAIHNLSLRKDRTFIKINCAAIPAGLLESELFGHEKGAFTGAIAQRIGRMELADRGTLFLDEVGDIPLELQPKLLRALQEKEIERVGGNRAIHVDARLVAATNRNLERMVQDHEFRDDLYYRLRVFPVCIPPLRERVEDIPILARYFTQKHAKRMNRKINDIPAETMNALLRWQWPGNVRELENFIERAVILSPGNTLRAPLAELQTPSAPAIPSASHDASLEKVERDHIIRVLREAGGAISGPNGAAARLGLKRTTLNSKMQKLGIRRRGI